MLNKLTNWKPFKSKKGFKRMLVLRFKVCSYQEGENTVESGHLPPDPWSRVWIVDLIDDQGALVRVTKFQAKVASKLLELSEKFCIVFLHWKIYSKMYSLFSRVSFDQLFISLSPSCCCCALFNLCFVCISFCFCLGKTPFYVNNQFLASWAGPARLLIRRWQQWGQRPLYTQTGFR